MCRIVRRWGPRGRLLLLKSYWTDLSLRWPLPILTLKKSETLSLKLTRCEALQVPQDTLIMTAFGRFCERLQLDAKPPY